MRGFFKFNPFCSNVLLYFNALYYYNNIAAKYWNVPILKPLKVPENQKFPGVFSEYKMRTLARNRLKRFSNTN